MAIDVRCKREDVRWIKHNKKLMKAGELKPNRVEMFEKFLAKMEEYKRVNQYA